MTGTKGPAPQVSLSADEARLIMLQAQGLVGSRGRQGGVTAMLRRVGAVQLDTISVLARSHELVAYARLGAVSRSAIERAYWQPGTARTFEYWSHAACILPIEEWPFYAFRRRGFRKRGMRWHEIRDEVCAKVLARIQAEGPLTATQLGGAKGGGPWWDWSETKIAVEWLLDTGDVICARRDGWRRVYDLPERVLAPELIGADLTDQECIVRLVGVTARALGVATASDLVDYPRLRSYGGAGDGSMGIADAAVAAGLTPVAIAGSGTAAAAAWADPEALAATSANGPPIGRHRATLLSPFDSLLWDRKRTKRVFGFEHSLEAYVPKAKRVRGYFTMPLLVRGTLQGWVDPARDGRTLVARTLSLTSAAAAEPMARALVEAAAWVGCDSVRLEELREPALGPRLRAALAARGA